MERVETSQGKLVCMIDGQGRVIEIQKNREKFRFVIVCDGQNPPRFDWKKIK